MLTRRNFLRILGTLPVVAVLPTSIRNASASEPLMFDFVDMGGLSLTERTDEWLMLENTYFGESLARESMWRLDNLGMVINVE